MSDEPIDWPRPPSLFWRLDETNTPVKCQTWDEYFAWCHDLETHKRDHHVGDDEIVKNGESIRVSTIFLMTPLPCDAAAEQNRALFFETMIFGGPLDGLEVRYATWDEAAAGHQRVCAEVRRLLALSPEELEAEMDQRAEGRYRFVREQALALGLPQDVAEKIGRAVAKPPRRGG